MYVFPSGSIRIFSLTAISCSLDGTIRPPYCCGVASTWGCRVRCGVGYTGGCGVGCGVGCTGGWSNGWLCCMVPSMLIHKLALYGMDDPKVFQNVGFTTPALRCLSMGCLQTCILVVSRDLVQVQKGEPMRGSVCGVGMKDVLFAPFGGTLTGEPYVRSPHPPLNDCLHLKVTPLLSSAANIADPCLPFLT